MLKPLKETKDLKTTAKEDLNYKEWEQEQKIEM
jgi:hypothetical protein